MSNAPERFWAKVEKTDGCWLWIAARDRDGYGVFRLGPPPLNNTGAHRVAYADRFGPIPEGLVIDHLCRCRACVNPEHLELVTNAENIRRGHPFREISTHCGKGHEWTDENTYIWSRDGSRICKSCNRDRARARYHALRSWSAA